MADDAAIGRHKMVSQIAADTYTVHTSLATDHKASRTKTINGEKKTHFFLEHAIESYFKSTELYFFLVGYREGGIGRV